MSPCTSYSSGRRWGPLCRLASPHEENRAVLEVIASGILFGVFFVPSGLPAGCFFLGTSHKSGPMWHTYLQICHSVLPYVLEGWLRQPNFVASARSACSQKSLSGPLSAPSLGPRLVHRLRGYDIMIIVADDAAKRRTSQWLFAKLNAEEQSFQVEISRNADREFWRILSFFSWELRLRLHGADIAPFVAQILDSYEVTQSKIAQIKVTLFAHVNKA